MSDPKSTDPYDGELEADADLGTSAEVADGAETGDPEADAAALQ